MKQRSIRTSVFVPSLLIALAAVLCMCLAPEAAARVVNVIFTFLTFDLGWVYLLAFVAAVGFSIYLCCSKYGAIRLAQPGEEKEYSEFNWAAMMFTAGLGVGLVVQSFIEPISFLSDPPFHIEPMSDMAYEYAHMYSQFLWGVFGWACYVPATVAVAWALYISRKKVLCLSAACEPVLGRHTRGIAGTVLDMISVVGTVGGIATSLGLGVPIVARIVCSLTGMENSIWLSAGILVVWFAIFGTATFLGLDKGIKALSSANMYLLFFMIAIIAIKSPLLDIINLECNSIGLMIDNLGMLLLGTDPITKSGFPQNWTVFYWAWMMSFIPMMALFVARISRGRTIRQIVVGEALWGGGGCMAAFGLLGGYALHLQRSGAVDLVAILKTSGREQAIIAIINTLPMAKLMLIVYLLLLFAFLATTVDSASFVLSSVCTHELACNAEPARWHRVLWSLILMLFALGLTLVGGLYVIQTASLIVGIFLVAVVVCAMLSVKKSLKAYKL